MAAHHREVGPWELARNTVDVIHDHIDLCDFLFLIIFKSSLIFNLAT